MCLVFPFADLIGGLKKIFKTANSKGRPPDGILIEAMGLADPAQVAQTFFAEDFIQQHFSFDCIITFVDAKHVIQHVDEDKQAGKENEAVEQIAFADRIMLNKSVLVDEATIEEVECRIRAINATVLIKRTPNSMVHMDFILGIKAFSMDELLEQESEFLDDRPEHQHDDRVSSIGIDVPGCGSAGCRGHRPCSLQEGLGCQRREGFQAMRILVFELAPAHLVRWRGAPMPDDSHLKNLDRQELTAGFLSFMAAGGADRHVLWSEL